MSSAAGAEAVGDDADRPAVALLSLVDPLHRAGQICGRLNAAHAELIDLVAELITDESWAISGIRSVQHWLTCFAGVSPATARDLVRIATRREELPALGRELDSGRLSLGQAAVVAAHTPIGYDTDVVDIAVHATVPQLRRALIRYDFTEPTSGNTGDQPPVAPDLLSVAAQPAELDVLRQRPLPPSILRTRRHRRTGPTSPHRSQGRAVPGHPGRGHYIGS